MASSKKTTSAKRATSSGKPPSSTRAAARAKHIEPGGDPGMGGPVVTESTGSSPSNQTPGFAGAVFDPLTGRHVEPGQTTHDANEPANPAPMPPQE